MVSSNGITATVDSGKGAGSPCQALTTHSLRLSYLNSYNQMPVEDNT